MADRILPGAYVTLNDLSQMPEGQTALTVGYVLDAKRGPVNELNLVTSPLDFLTKYTFSGKPSISDDKTFWSILKVLSRTNKMYVCRAAKNALYGGLIVKAAEEIGTLSSAIKAVGSNKAYLVVSGDVTDSVSAGDVIMVSGTTAKETTKKEADINGYYVVAAVSAQEDDTKIELTADLADAFTAGEGSKAVVSKAPGIGLTSQKIATIATADTSKSFEFTGDQTAKFALGNKFLVKNCTAEANNKSFTILDDESADPISYDVDGNKTVVKVKEDVVAATDGEAFYESIAVPENIALGEDDCFAITGKNPGAYNGDLKFEITSSIDNEDMVYKKGNIVGGKEVTFDTMTLTVINGNTNVVLEQFTFSRDPEARAIDGTSLFVDSIVGDNSAYIKLINNENGSFELPASTVEGKALQATGGDNGDAVDTAALIAALQPFKDKTVTVSVLGNGCSAAAETKEFHQAMMEITDIRKDMIAFLNNPASTENKTIPSDRAQAIVDYKKDLGNTSFLGAMYAPHVNVSDTFNNRTVKIGADALAISGWLNVISNLGYPYAYAGPRNGLVQGVTTDWKIGDESGEASMMNNASINYVAFDGKVGRYYMQCQNTLQVAASKMRNLGTVFNVLDIKEHFVDMLKEYTQLPSTEDLRRDIIDNAKDYLGPMEGKRFSKYLFQDMTTDIDLANDELHFLLTICPTPYAQRIYLVMNVVNETFDFSIVQSL